MRKPTMKSLVKKLDKVFSIYVRKRDTLPDGTIRCFTCGALLTFKTAQCGHFVKRQHRSLRWEGLNAAVQCARCNMYLGGAQDEFAHRLMLKHDAHIVKQLMEEKRRVVKYTRADLEEMIKKYESRIEMLD